MPRIALRITPDRLKSHRRCAKNLRAERLDRRACTRREQMRAWRRIQRRARLGRPDLPQAGEGKGLAAPHEDVLRNLHRSGFLPFVKPSAGMDSGAFFWRRGRRVCWRLSRSVRSFRASFDGKLACWQLFTACSSASMLASECQRHVELRDAIKSRAAIPSSVSTHHRGPSCSGRWRPALRPPA